MLERYWQRGRSHHGQVIVVTQSAADHEALTQQPGLLASLTDNFTGFAIHRQNAPETRDWLAKLMGTTALGEHMGIDDEIHLTHNAIQSGWQHDAGRADWLVRPPHTQLFFEYSALLALRSPDPASA